MTIRNFLISMGAVCALVLLMPLYAKASYQAPNGETYRYKYSISTPFYQSTTYTADLYTNEKIAGYTGGSTTSNKRFYMIYNGNANKLNWSDSVPGTYDNVNNSTWNNFNYTDVTGIIHPEFCLYVTSGTTGHIISAALSDLSTDIPIYSDWNELVSYLNAIDVDLENIVYDPFIPTPEFTVTYIPNSSSATQFFPVEFNLINTSSDYFVEIQMENLTPSYLGITPYVQNNNNYSTGNYVVYKFNQFESHAIADKYNFVLADNMTSGVLNGLLSAAWRSDITSYSSSDVDVISASGNESFNTSPVYTALKNAWLNTYRNIACFYGNNTGVSIRYFQIRDGVAYGGKVKSWTSLYQGQFSESIPDYYVPYETSQGYERESSNDIIPVETSNPIADLPANQYGKKTGFNININLGSNVPNYPDYPTIATYNLDNMLVSTIDNAKDIGKFFGGVTGFFQATLAFIPPIVWQVVAFGLALSIVVMFLKIL